MKELKSILVIEDSDIETMKVKRAFNKLGVSNNIYHSKNGQEALEWLDDNNDELPGLILLDLNMPVMSGIEFLEIIKENESYKKIPVVVLTTSKHEADKQKSFENHVAGYMIKPVKYSDFVELLDSIKHYWTNSELPY